MTTATVEPTTPKLTRDRILTAERELAERNGIAGLSMRLLADELGVSTMAAYRHIPSKDLIVDLIVTGVLEAAVPTSTDDDDQVASTDGGEVVARVTATWGFLERIPGLRGVLGHDQDHVQAWAERATQPVSWIPDPQLVALRDGLITAVIGSPTPATIHLTATALVEHQLRTAAANPPETPDVE